MLIRKLSILILFGILAALPAFSANFGTFGKTYPIAEQNSIEEMKEAARKVDWSRYFSKSAFDRKLKEYRPKDNISLPLAQEKRIRQVDMTYTLDFDVRDREGTVVYPKGYSFNPLDYIAFRKTVVVINGKDPEQIEWFRTSKYANDPQAILLITEGVYYEVSEKVDQAVFFATEKIASRLQLQFVPSVAYQKGKMMEVVEIDLSEGKDEKPSS
jgi:conjugal transfer pilus assembly protein TraW